jgi:hypothetical protein
MIKTGFSPERIDAEEKYAIALAASRRAEDVSEEAYKAAEITLADARLRLVIAEIRWPTPIEKARRVYSAEADAIWNTPLFSP